MCLYQQQRGVTMLGSSQPGCAHAAALLCAALLPCSFLFKDQFIELTTSVPEDSDLYGVGESSLSGGLLLPRNGKVISAWVRDSAASEPDINTYSAQPFYLQLNKGMCSIKIWGRDSQGPPFSKECCQQ